jgi:A/G-specific adenine glycosylase
MEGKSKYFVRCILEWFSKNRRNFPWRTETSPYKVLIAEKLLQQTSSGHVMKVYGKFLEKFPDIKKLAEAQISEIEEVIRPLGFHRQRARQLKEMATQILSSHEGNIPSKRDELLEIIGVGKYIANALLCFAFNKDVLAIDTNVRRVVRRYFGQDLSDKEIENKLRRVIPLGRAREFNWGVIDFSALVCSRSPKCKICPLSSRCSFFKRSTRRFVDK